MPCCTLIAAVLAQLGLWAVAVKSKLFGGVALTRTVVSKGPAVLAAALFVEVLAFGGVLLAWHAAPGNPAIPHRICSVAEKAQR